MSTPTREDLNNINTFSEMLPLFCSSIIPDTSSHIVKLASRARLLLEKTKMSDGQFDPIFASVLVPSIILCKKYYFLLNLLNNITAETMIKFATEFTSTNVEEIVGGSRRKVQRGGGKLMALLCMIFVLIFIINATMDDEDMQDEMPVVKAPNKVPVVSQGLSIEKHLHRLQSKIPSGLGEQLRMAVFGAPDFKSELRQTCDDLNEKAELIAHRFESECIDEIRKLDRFGFSMPEEQEREREEDEQLVRVDISQFLHNEPGTMADLIKPASERVVAPDKPIAKVMQQISTTAACFYIPQITLILDDTTLNMVDVPFEGVNKLLHLLNAAKTTLQSKRDLEMSDVDQAALQLYEANIQLLNNIVVEIITIPRNFALSKTMGSALSKVTDGFNTIERLFGMINIPLVFEQEESNILNMAKQAKTDIKIQNIYAAKQRAAAEFEAANAANVERARQNVNIYANPVASFFGSIGKGIGSVVGQTTGGTLEGLVTGIVGEFSIITCSVIVLVGVILLLWALTQFAAVIQLVVSGTTAVINITVSPFRLGIYMVRSAGTGLWRICSRAEAEQVPQIPQIAGPVAAPVIAPAVAQIAPAQNNDIGDLGFDNLRIAPPPVAEERPVLRIRRRDWQNAERIAQAQPQPQAQPQAQAQAQDQTQDQAQNVEEVTGGTRKYRRKYKRRATRRRNVRRNKKTQKRKRKKSKRSLKSR